MTHLLREDVATTEDAETQEEEEEAEKTLTVTTIDKKVTIK